jgi:hypothetical protein
VAVAGVAPCFVAVIKAVDVSQAVVGH